MRFKADKTVSRWLPRIEDVLASFLVLLLALVVSSATASPLDAAMDKVFTVRSADGEDRFLGSAFVWADGTVAVTNAHVVGEAEEVRLIDRNGVEETALVIASDPVRDVAVISIASGREGLMLADAAPELGDEVFALGAPLGVEFTLTEGLISATERQVDITVPMMLLQHDAAVNPGSSGGPLVDAEGQLLGMNSQIADGSRMFVGIAYAISAADLDRIVTGLIDETLAPYPHLGLSARAVDLKVAEALGVEPGGMLIDAVGPKGLAEASGLKAGDIITGVNGATLTEAGDLAFAVEGALEAGEVTLDILRQQESVEVTLSLASLENEGGTALREIGSSAAPAMVKSYSLAALGIVLDETGAVTDLTSNSPAADAGLAKGDRILMVNGAEVDLASFELTEPALILVEAPGGATRHLRLDPWTPSDGVRPVGGANVLDPAVVVF